MEYILPNAMLIIGLAVGGGCVWLVMRTKTTALNERLLVREESYLEKLALLEDAEKRLSETFQAMSAEALQNNNQSFLELAKENFGKHHGTTKGDLEKRQQKFEALIHPVKESLKKVDDKLQQLETARAGAYVGLLAQVKVLRTETASLATALRKPDVRGRWGELQLQRVVELAGMTEHCDFYQQETAGDEGDQVRPDMRVRLPGSKNVIIDSKAPLSAYLDAAEAQTEDERKAKMDAFAKHVRTHVTTLGKKNYYEKFDNSPEFVVLFLPGEAFFSAALKHDPELIEFAADQRVIIASPLTLIALLRAVAHGWQQELMAENAKEISDLGRELYKRISDVGGHLMRLGKNLDKATEAYNNAIGSIESRVLVQARRFDQMGAAPSGVEIPELEPIERTSRMLQAPELVGNAKGLDANDGERT